MTTSRKNHPRSAFALAAMGMAGTLLAAAPTSASAMPGRDDPPSRGHFVAHGCFTTPHVWSEELGGPLPRCYTYVP